MKVREVIKWLQGLGLSTPVHNPRRDMANGVAAAEIISFYCEARRESIRRGSGNGVFRFGSPTDAGDDTDGENSSGDGETVVLNTRAIDFSASSSDAKRNNWNEVLRVLRALRCKTVDEPLAEAVMHLHSTAAQAVLENLYEFFTRRRLAVRTVDPLLVFEDAKPSTTKKKSGGGSKTEMMKTRNADTVGGAASPTSTVHSLTQGNYLASRHDVLMTASLLQRAGEVTKKRGTTFSKNGKAAGISVHETSAAAAANAGVQRTATGEAMRLFLDPEESTSLAGGGGDADAVAFTGVRSSSNGGSHHSRLPAAAAALQTQLALTRNAELAAGPRALGGRSERVGGGASCSKVSRYDRPTASSLVHVASGSRHDVSLTQRTFTEDERTARLRNEAIVAQHALVAGTFYPRVVSGPSMATTTTTKDRAREEGGACSMKKMKTAATYAVDSSSMNVNAAAASAPSLTAVLRGPFAAKAAARDTRKSGGRRGSQATCGRRGNKIRAGGGDGRSNGGASGGGGGTGGDAGGAASIATTAASTAATSAPGVRRIQVNTLCPSLRTALAQSGVYLKGDERAGEKSAEFFESVGWHLQSGISHILRDVLQARRELQPLLDRCRRDSLVHRGDDVLLQDLLSCVLAHRTELNSETLDACWEALQQHVTGIAMSILHRTAGFRFLMQRWGYAFTWRAAQVPLLHVSHRSNAAASSGMATGEVENHVAGCGGNSGRAVAAATGVTSANTSTMTPRSCRRPSYAAVALARASHAMTTSTAAASTTTVNGRVSFAAPASFPAQRALLRDDDAFNLGRVYVFLGDLGAALQEQIHLHSSASPEDDTAEWNSVPRVIVERYLLPVAQQFILSGGSPASVEAVARILVRTLYPTDATFSTGVNEGDIHAAVTACGGVDTRTQELLVFLHGTIRDRLTAQLTHPLPLSSSSSAGITPTGDGITTDDAVEWRHGLLSYHVLSQLLRRQREQERGLLTTSEHGETDDEALECEEVMNREKLSGTANSRSGGTTVHRAWTALASAVRATTQDAMRLAKQYLSHPVASGATDMRAIGVGFLLLAAPTARLGPLVSPRDDRHAAATTITAPTPAQHEKTPGGVDGRETSASDGESILDVARAMLLQPLLSEETSTFTVSTAWELRVLSLELLSLLSSRVASEPVSDEDRDLTVSVAHEDANCRASTQQQQQQQQRSRQANIRAALRELENASIACLNACVSAGSVTYSSSHDATSLREQQLALSVVGRRLTPDLQPRLAARWLEVLTALPADVLHRCLLPHEQSPLSLQLDSDKSADGRALFVSTLTTSNTSTNPTAATGSYSSNLNTGANTPSPSSSSISVLLGTVEPAYVVAPLNQAWNTSGIVHLMLSHLPTLREDVVLAMIAAALISPQPLDKQSRELARNLHAAESMDALGASVAVSTDGDEAEGRLAFTLRDVVGSRADLFARDDGCHDDGEAERSRDSNQNDGRAANSAADGGAALWRSALRMLRLTLHHALSDHAPTPANSAYDRSLDADANAITLVKTEEETEDTWETAAAVLFSFFRRCASPTEMAKVTTRYNAGADTVQCLLEWMDFDVCACGEDEGDEDGDAQYEQ